MRTPNDQNVLGRKANIGARPSAVHDALGYDFSDSSSSLDKIHTVYPASGMENALNVLVFDIMSSECFNSGMPGFVICLFFANLRPDVYIIS